MEQRIYRVVGLQKRREGWMEQRAWKYFSRQSAIGRAQALALSGNLVEFSYADVEWKPSSEWEDE